MKTVHELKLSPMWWNAVVQERKTFEVRKHDRGYGAGDELHLREWSERGGYSGAECRAEVTYVYGPGPGLAPDHVVLAIRVVWVGPGKSFDDLMVPE